MSSQRDPGAEPGPVDAELVSRSAPNAAESQRLARELTGALPCAACGYDLRGLSVRDVCSECGTPVRATILAAVDPYATVLRPLDAPRLTALGLLLWSLGAFAAAILTWALRAADAYSGFTAVTMPLRTIALGGTICIVLSGLGAIALIRPHGGIPLWQVIAAIAGVVACFGVATIYWQIHVEFDPVHTRPYFLTDGPLPERSRLRLVQAALLLAAIFGLRPNGRLLAARSLLLRMGRVDRQAMLAVAAAVGVAALGDLIELGVGSLGPRAQHIGYTLGDFLIAVGSMLLTLGLAGVLVDCIRIAPSLLRRPLAARQVIGVRRAAATTPPPQAEAAS